MMITIYCTKSLIEPNHATLERWLEQADLHKLAESFKIDDQRAIHAARSRLWLETNAADNFHTAVLFYQQEGLRPVVLHRITHADTVQRYVQAALQKVEQCALYVQEDIARTQEIIVIEYDALAYADIGAILAHELARWSIQQSCGYMQDHIQQWWTLENGTWQQLPNPKHTTIAPISH